MTFDIGLNEVCVRVGVRYVITKFSGMDSLPNFLTHGAPLRALRARGSSAKTVTYESAKCVSCNTRKCTHNGFVSDLLKWALKCRFYAT